jgi:LmbE family N-acetylglucosaminyl deacetylase
MPAKRKLLGIFAHPDDESFGPGATLARYAREGAEVHVIIATDGIAGSLEDMSHLQDHDSLAQVRSAELARAAVALGVAAVWSLPYRDSGMRGSPDNQHPAALIQQPLEHTTEEILGYLRRLQPQVIVTHDPYGGYGHPDHVRVCEAATAAFYLARGESTHGGSQGKNGDSAGPQKLYYTAFPKWLIKFFVQAMPLFGRDPTAFGRNRDINLVEISQWDTPVTTRIAVAPYLAAKQAASEAHASQYSGGPSWARALPAPIRRRVLEHELFTRAYPAPPAGAETDLFAGVTLSSAR